MKRLAAFAPLIVLAAIALLSVVLLMRGGERQTVTAGQLDRAQPHYSLARLGGGAPVTSEDLAGRAHVINLFASWCTPCRAEHAVLTALQARGVAIVGVAYKDRPEQTRAFLDQLGDPFVAVGLDPNGRYGLELGMAGVPETFVIGADGRIRAVHRGPLTPEIVEREILPALAAP